MELIPQTLIDNFHFLRPLFLLGLLPALLLFLFLRYLQGNQSNWTRAIDPSLLPYLLDKTMTPAQSYPLYGLLTIWVLAEVAVRRNWVGLLAIPATFCIGVSCGLPLYLFLRTAPVR